MVPLAGIEPALLAELDFESSASTNSATGASAGPREAAGREAGGIIAAGEAGSRRDGTIHAALCDRCDLDSRAGPG